MTVFCVFCVFCYVWGELERARCLDWFELMVRGNGPSEKMGKDADLARLRRYDCLQFSL